MTPDIHALEERFRELTFLLYDTRVTPDRLERDVMPYISDSVVFVDPWQSEGGKKNYREGLSGFHAMFRFRFEIKQVTVTLDQEKGGRALVDGVMQLGQFAPFLTYPLRTILRYDFTLVDNQPLIHFHEEMWSFGDMLEAIPVFGAFYARVFRPAFSRGFLVASRIASRRRFGTRG